MLMAAELTTIIFIALLALVIFLLWKDASSKRHEGLTTGGYGVTSGLYFNNIPQQVWTNSEDRRLMWDAYVKRLGICPDDEDAMREAARRFEMEPGGTYSSTIGRVVV